MRNREERGQRTEDRCRRGAALVMALVALLVVTLVAGALVQSLLAANRQSRRYADELQAQWLAEAGLARAAALLKADANYRGETWNAALGVDETDVDDPAPDEPDPHNSGQVTITIEPATKQITVVAVYPTDEHRRVLVRREGGGGGP